MRLKITGKNITLTEGIKSAVKDKIKKIEKLVGDDAAVDVMLSAKHGKAKGQRAEITIKTKSSVVRAEVTDEDLYRAINSAVDVVTGRLKKIKEKAGKEPAVTVSEQWKEKEKMMLLLRKSLKSEQMSLK